MGVVVSSEVDKFLEARVLDVATSRPATGQVHSKASNISAIKTPQSHNSSIRDMAISYHSRSIEAFESTSSSRLILDTAKKRGLPVLKLKIDSIQDDIDWIQVDEEGTDEDGMASPRRNNPNNFNRGRSYFFTGSGTMLLEGFSPGIGEKGLRMGANDQEYKNKIPMHERLVILGKLGSGSTSTVYKALDIQQMQLVALKKISVADKAKRRQMVKEISTLTTMSGRRAVHPQPSHYGRRQRPSAPEFFPTIYEAVDASTFSADQSFDDSMGALGAEHIVEFYDAFSNLDDCSIMISMEYMDGGSLQDNIVDAGGCRQERLLASIAYQALCGMTHLHAKNRLHRDLKPANLLINHKGYVKLSDFGITKQLLSDADSKLLDLEESGSSLKDSLRSGSDDQQQQGFKKTRTFVGTASYMSPERIEGRDYSFPSDVWALGLVMLALANGHTPIETQAGYWSLLHTIRDLPPPNLDDKGDWSREFRDFVAICLKADPSERPTSSELLQHPFLVQRLDEDRSHVVTVELAHAKEEMFSVLRSLEKHLSSLQRESGEGEEGKSQVHTILHVLLFASHPGDDSSVADHRLRELCDQLSISECKGIEYAREYMKSIE